jgi:hypothetical protein
MPGPRPEGPSGRTSKAPTASSPQRPSGAPECSHGWSAGSPTGDPELNSWKGKILIPAPAGAEEDFEWFEAPISYQVQLLLLLSERSKKRVHERVATKVTTPAFSLPAFSTARSLASRNMRFTTNVVPGHLYGRSYPAAAPSLPTAATAASRGAGRHCTAEPGLDSSYIRSSVSEACAAHSKPSGRRR